MIEDRTPVKTPVMLRLGRIHGGDEDYFCLEVEDRASGLRILDVKIDLEQALEFLTARMAKGVGEIRRSEKFGRKLEVKRVGVPLDRDRYNGHGSERATEILNKEIKHYCDIHYRDWEPDTESSFNHHRWNNKDKTYEAVVRRWVNATSG